MLHLSHVGFQIHPFGVNGPQPAGDHITILKVKQRFTAHAGRLVCHRTGDFHLAGAGHGNGLESANRLPAWLGLAAGSERSVQHVVFDGERVKRCQIDLLLSGLEAFEIQVMQRGDLEIHRCFRKSGFERGRFIAHLQQRTIHPFTIRKPHLRERRCGLEKR